MVRPVASGDPRRLTALAFPAPSFDWFSTGIIVMRYLMCLPLRAPQSNTSKMRMGVGAPGVSTLLKDGFKHFSGLEEAILKNVEACKQLAQITRTSLGPNGA